MEKKRFWTTVETQIRPDGSFGLMYDSFDNENRAWSKLYAILMEASVSELPYHAAMLVRDDGMIVGSKVFDRRVVPQPEPMEPEVVETTEEG